MRQCVRFCSVREARFKFPAALVQQWLGVTAGLLGS